MKRDVIISNTAQNKLDNILEYLRLNWPQKVQDDFIKKLDMSIKIIKNNPEIFPNAKREQHLRRCVVSKQTTLYYRFDSEKIYLLTLFDTRQNPTKLKKDLNKT